MVSASEARKLDLGEEIELADGRKAMVIRHYSLKSGGYRYRVRLEGGRNMMVEGCEAWEPSDSEAHRPEENEPYVQAIDRFRKDKGLPRVESADLKRFALMPIATFRKS